MGNNLPATKKTLARVFFATRNRDESPVSV